MDRYGQLLIFLVQIFSTLSDTTSEDAKLKEYRENNERNLHVEEKMPNYPYQEVEKYVNDNPDLKTYLSNPLPNTAFRAAEFQAEGEDMCKSRSNPIFTPQMLYNTDGKEMIIINTDKYKQIIQSVICARNDGGHCSKVDIFGYTSECVQLFITTKLIVFNGTAANRFIGRNFQNFLIPSCCACRLKKHS